MVRCCTWVVLLLAVLVCVPFLPRPAYILLPDLKGQVCVVTGASRGIGRGVALGLGEQGCTVYITGRSGSELQRTCKEVQAAGGECVAAQVDSASDSELEKFFERIDSERGQIDVLVNNAFAGVSVLPELAGKPFWDTPGRGIGEVWDAINGVGLRSHYVASTLAARIMRRRKKGIIINISSLGGSNYIFNVAYGIGKAAMDRMANDMAVELATEGITMLSLWPGLVKTEYVQGAPDNFSKLRYRRGLRVDMNFDSAQLINTALAETVLFNGRVIAAVARDTNHADYTGKVALTATLAQKYGVVDERGVRSPPMASGKFFLSLLLKPILERHGAWTLPDGAPSVQATPNAVAEWVWVRFPDLDLPRILRKLDSYLDFA